MKLSRRVAMATRPIRNRWRPALMLLATLLVGVALGRATDWGNGEVAALAGSVTSVAASLASWASGAASLVAVGALIGGAAGYLGTIRAARIAQQESRRNREAADHAREQAREDARLIRFVDDKRVLYTDLLMACDQHRREVEAQVNWRHLWRHGSDVAGKDPGIGSSEPARRAYLAIRMIAGGDVVSAAQELYDSTTTLGRHHAYRRPPPDEPDDGPEPPDEKRWSADIDAWDTARWGFESAVKADLGVSVPPSSRPVEPRPD